MRELIHHFNRIDEELREFKQREFDYRTECQDVVSAARLEADAMPDKLAELEKVILDYYLDKGYQVGVGGWDFNVEIKSDYKSKSLLVYFSEYKHDHYSQVFKINTETTKEMFDEVINHFSLNIEPLQEDVKLELDDINQSTIYKLAGYESDGRE